MQPDIHNLTVFFTRLKKENLHLGKDIIEYLRLEEF